MLVRAIPSLTALWVAGALVFPARAAWAAGALEITGAPTSANGLTSRALGHSAETTYFNPALLGGTAPLMEIGGFVLHTAGRIELADRPADVDVPLTVYDAQVPAAAGGAGRLSLRPLPTSALPQPRGDTRVSESRAFAVVGVVRPLFDSTFRFGFLGVLPLRGFLDERAFFADEREQYFTNRLDFERLGDRSGVASFTVSLGGRLTPWLSAGLGIDLGYRTTTEFALYVPDASDQETALLNPRLRTSTRAAPIAGVALHPTDELTMTATVHAPVGVHMKGANTIRFWNYTYPEGRDHLLQRFDFSQATTPLRVGFGGAYGRGARPGGEHVWDAGATVVLEEWSQYRDRHQERPADHWRNTITPAVGGAVATDHGRFTLDVAYAPTPVPDQIGRTNYVDNARTLASLGWEAPVRWFRTALGLGLYLHGQWMVPRSVTKRADAPHPVLDEFPDDAFDFVTGEPLPEATGLQTNNPGYPGFSSRGFLVGGGFSVRLPR
jgi:long-chain fatty acid transport protein